MEKPDKFPEWASDGTEIVEPTEGRKDTGWETSQRPPAQYFNWYMNKVFEWTKYLAGPFRGLEDLALASFRPAIQAAFTEDIRGIAADQETHLRRVVAVGTNGGIISTEGDDTSEFVVRTPGSAYAGDFNAVAYDPVLDGYAAVGTGEEIQTSPDTETWTERNTGSDDLRDVASDGDGTFVAVGLNATIYSSTALATWTARTSAIATHDILAVTFGAGLFVAAGEAGSIQTSPDGITWTARTSGTSDNLSFLRFAGGRFVVNKSNGYLESTDGITWVSRTVTDWPTTIFETILTENALYLVLSANGDGSGIATIYPEAPTVIDHVQHHIVAYEVGAALIDSLGVPYLAGEGGFLSIAPRLPIPV